jgi:hypothetical protein
MRVLLYDVDSVIPNISLMKLSAHYKSLGHSVDLVRGEGKSVKMDFSPYDLGFASTIFTKNTGLISNFPWEVGGTGVSLEKILPVEIEHIMPDYSLYPENVYSIGFATRGCIRNCDFCFVPKKEGLLHFNAHVSEFLSSSTKKLMLLDNNIFGYENYKSVFSEIRASKVRTCFKQGMDFRLLTDDKVNELLSIKYDGDYTFAYDNVCDREIIERNVVRYQDKFPPWRMKFFVLVGFNSSIKDDICRVMYLKENRILAYIMRHENAYLSANKDFYTDLAAWANQVFAFKKLTFEEFLYRRHRNQERIKFSLNLWKENDHQ